MESDEANLSEEVPILDSHLEEIRQRKSAADADPDSLIGEEEFWRRVDSE